MEYDRAEIKVGLVLLAGIVLLVAFFALINRWTVAEHREAAADFANVMGLKVDTGVHYAGRRAGWVKELRYVRVPNPDGLGAVTRVRVVLAVATDVPLTDQDVVYIDRSLTGEVVVEIEPGPGQVFGPDAEILLASREVPTFASLKEELGLTLDELRVFVDTALVSEESELRRAIRSFGEFSASAHTILEENREPLGQAVTDASELFSSLAERQPDIVGTVEDIRQAAATVRATVEDAREAAATLRATVEEAQETMTTVRATVEDAGERVRETAADVRQTAASARATVEDLQRREIGATVQAILEDVRRNPWKLVFRPWGEDTYSQHLFDTARQSVLISGELRRAAEELERLRASTLTEAERQHLDELLQAVDERLERLAALQDELWQALKAKQP